MSTENASRPIGQSAAEAGVRGLYRGFLDNWNRRHAAEIAALFAEAGNAVGFDGSQVNGRAEIEAHLSQIFRDHPTAAYVAKVREVRFLTFDIAVLRGVAGMVPRVSRRCIRASTPFRPWSPRGTPAAGRSSSSKIRPLPSTADRN